MQTPDRPAHLAALDPSRILDVDVRDDLRKGREPFRRIMEARQALAPGQVLRLRAIFEPQPLYGVMARQGLDHWTERLTEDDWMVWFYPADVTSEVHTLDVRGLEPPEPMVRTLEALEDLPRGHTLIQLNVRVPGFLLPELESRGFEYALDDDQPDQVRVVIRHADTPRSAAR